MGFITTDAQLELPIRLKMKGNYKTWSLPPRIGKILPRFMESSSNPIHRPTCFDPLSSTVWYSATILQNRIENIGIWKSFERSGVKLKHTTSVELCFISGWIPQHCSTEKISGALKNNGSGERMQNIVCRNGQLLLMTRNDFRIAFKPYRRRRV